MVELQFRTWNLEFRTRNGSILLPTRPDQRRKSMMTNRFGQAKIRYFVFLVVLALGLVACDGGAATPTPTATTGTTTEATATTGQAAEPTATTAAMADAGEIIWLSTQLRPVEEGEKLRNVILKDFKGKVEYLPEDTGPFVDRMLAEARGGNVT